jgi:FkbM family methyltransferase
MLESFVKSFFHLMGLDVSRRTSSFPFNPYDAQKKILEWQGIQTPVIFDLGGHRGETVVHYRARFPEAEIYCFEPFPDSLAFLKKQFGGDTGLNIVPLAVSDRPEQKMLFINEVDATNSLLPVASSTRRYLPGEGGTKASIRVDTTSIDEFVKGHNIEGVHILKMDIQGSELSALKGAVRTLSMHPAPLIYTEVMFVPHYENQPLLNDIWDFLSGHGYSLFELYYLKRARNGQLKCADALFVSPDVRRGFIDAHSPEP